MTKRPQRTRLTHPLKPRLTPRSGLLRRGACSGREQQRQQQQGQCVQLPERPHFSARHPQPPLRPFPLCSERFACHGEPQLLLQDGRAESPGPCDEALNAACLSSIGGKGLQSGLHKSSTTRHPHLQAQVGESNCRRSASFNLQASSSWTLVQKYQPKLNHKSPTPFWTRKSWGPPPLATSPDRHETSVLARKTCTERLKVFANATRILSQIDKIQPAFMMRAGDFQLLRIWDSCCGSI